LDDSFIHGFFSSHWKEASVRRRIGDAVGAVVASIALLLTALPIEAMT
jgi:hypothetical protein